MDERQKMLLRKQEDTRFVQGCCCVLIAIVLELFLFQVRDYYVPMLGNETRLGLLSNGLALLKWGGYGLIAGGLAWMCHSFTTGRGDIFYPIATFLGGVVAFATQYGVSCYGDKGVNILLFLIPAWAGLGLVFCLYQVEFFISAFFTGLAGVSLWLCGQTTLVSQLGETLTQAQVTFYVCLNGTIVVILLGFFCVNKAYNQGGVLEIGKKELTLISDMKDSSSLWLVGLSGLISLVALAIAVTFGFQVIYYVTLGLLGWLFVLLVYYTVKMM